MTTDRPAPRGVQAGFLSIVSGGRTCRTDELSEARRSRGDERRPRNRTWPLGVGRGAREPCCPHAPAAHIDRPSDGEVFARTEESQHWSAAGRDPRGPMMCLTVKNDRTARALNGRQRIEAIDASAGVAGTLVSEPAATAGQPLRRQLGRNAVTSGRSPGVAA